MRLSFDLNNHSDLTVDVDGKELDIDGGATLAQRDRPPRPRLRVINANR